MSEPVYKVRYHGDPDYSQNCGYAEIKCQCGEWADFGLEHWDNHDETEGGENYDIHCSKCGKEGRGDSHDVAVCEFKHSPTQKSKDDSGSPISASSNESFPDEVQKLIDSMGGGKFEPNYYYDPDGDCYEFIFSDEAYFGKRVSSWLTLYFCFDDPTKVTGLLINNVSKMDNGNDD